MGVISDAHADILADADLASTVTYARGEASVDLAAVGTELRQEEEREYAARVTARSRRYLVDAADLVLDGAETLPRRGDTITETIDGYDCTLEVFDQPGIGPWKYAESRRHLIVFAKEIARAAAGS
jgi:hypothetical protein